MTPSSGDVAAAAAQIDAANAADPTVVVVRGAEVPLALAHGRLAQEWVERLAPEADDVVRLAARAHHLRRWVVPRATYPDGRAGYLRWRRDQKARHARELAEILTATGYGPADVERAGRITRREGLGTDPGTQAVEDAACLVFIETQLADVAGRLDRDHLIAVIRKTAAKMSSAALDQVGEIPLDDTARSVLAEALC